LGLLVVHEVENREIHVPLDPSYCLDLIGKVVQASSPILIYVARHLELRYLYLCIHLRVGTHCIVEEETETEIEESDETRPSHMFDF
jgi:hypothetical protein